jgi:hypothetical protein
MPSTSEAQMNFFKLVNAYKKGGLKKSDVSKSVVDTAKSMTQKEIEDYLKLEKKSAMEMYGMDEEEYTTLTAEDITKFISFILDHGNMRSKMYRSKYVRI